MYLRPLAARLAHVVEWEVNSYYKNEALRASNTKVKILKEFIDLLNPLASNILDNWQNWRNTIKYYTHNSYTDLIATKRLKASRKSNHIDRTGGFNTKATTGSYSQQFKISNEKLRKQSLDLPSCIGVTNKPQPSLRQPNGPELGGDTNSRRNQARGLRSKESIKAEPWKRAINKETPED